MFVQFHIFLGLIFSEILYLFFPQINLQAFFLIFLSSFLIDVDHYIYYLIRKRDFNLKNSYNWFMKQVKLIHQFSISFQRKVYIGFNFLHGIEFLILLLCSGYFFSKIFYFIFIGVLFHLTLDLFYEIYSGERLDKISTIYDFLNLKKLIFIENAYKLRKRN